jgi:hypothetical protein
MYGWIRPNRTYTITWFQCIRRRAWCACQPWWRSVAGMLEVSVWLDAPAASACSSAHALQWRSRRPLLALSPAPRGGRAASWRRAAPAGRCLPFHWCFADAESRTGAKLRLQAAASPSARASRTRSCAPAPSCAGSTSRRGSHMPAPRHRPTGSPGAARAGRCPSSG